MRGVVKIEYMNLTEMKKILKKVIENILFHLENLVLAFNIDWSYQLLAESNGVQWGVSLLEAVSGRNHQIVSDQSPATLEETFATYNWK
jgi:hypothetical protein